ncbi:MAG TPA: MlaD family protein [Spirochaetota bacterium]|nr:MlaD family protein [Spirochaetota bacterium]HPS87548.1 MlaD family protein [Spirochaetota bacterium]
MKKISLKNPNELRVGIFILAPVVILLIFIILKLGYSLSGSTIDVYLKIDNISAIKKGTAIKLKGYDIGRVVELRPVYKPGLHFLATMRINSDIDLHEDCSAIILNQNIIGDTVVEMRNPERKGSPLRNGDVIEGLEYVNLEAILKDVHNLLNTVTDTVNVVKDISIDSKQNIKGLLTDLGTSITSVNSILADSAKEVPEILQSLRQTAKVVNEISVEFKKRPMGFILSGEKNGEKQADNSNSEEKKPKTE